VVRVGVLPTRCVWKSGVVQEVVIVYEELEKLFRYILCSPSFADSCQTYIEHLKRNGVDFIKVSTTEKEYVDEIERKCYAAKYKVFE
jgi:hypothetical protein